MEIKDILKLAAIYNVDQSDTLESFLCELLNMNCNDLYKEINKAKFDALPEEEKQTKLMETAIRIQEVYDEMAFAQHLNPDKIDDMDPELRIQVFVQWAREFEYKYFDTERYEEDFFELSSEFAEEKLNEKFGNNDTETE